MIMRKAREIAHGELHFNMHLYQEEKKVNTIPRMNDLLKNTGFLPWLVKVGSLSSSSGI